MIFIKQEQPMRRHNLIALLMTLSSSVMSTSLKSIELDGCIEYGNNEVMCKDTIVVDAKPIIGETYIYKKYHYKPVTHNSEGKFWIFKRIIPK